MESPAWMFSKALSHRQKVQRLYKRGLREVFAWYGGDHVAVRYHQVLLRARFDAAADEKDTRKAQVLLADGCRELWEKRAFKPARFPLDPKGSSYDRERESHDALLDTESWTGPDREQYPYYFNRREARKKEILEHWNKIEKSWDEELNSIQKELPKEKAAIGPQ
ncbi:unnamed protein product [Bursaphelenchus okinawaensis]|uniref:NADH dehydrogenase [ubiquinone] 1 beta subcomplex subunit 9 n=1 Tax=Bursaphelenchus okinawaensis TaxID=465554 RepID=A0A811JQH6_9BILA|nr:unnamed protein product [Bursaphelenchus okinawaensis]CAG9078168.1 unnamed protein product [Bursaphelenchus okinawaensis]